MTNELTWVRAEITKLLVDVSVNGRPSTKDLARSLGRLLIGYKAPAPTLSESYRTALGVERLNNGG